MSNAYQPTKPARIKARQALSMHGLSLKDCVDTEVPACCAEGCMTEPDGECEHGHPSVLHSLAGTIQLKMSA